jgi:hypothetical protein
MSSDGLSTSCQATCGAPDMRVCHSTGACPAGSCTGLVQGHYRVCQ